MIYDQLRSAHLERIISYRNDVVIIYRRNSYDLDQDLLSQVNAKRMSFFGLILFLTKGRFDVVELNEPLFMRALPWTIITIAAICISAMLSRRELRIVSYAIENLSIEEQVSGRGYSPARLLTSLARISSKVVFTRLHKLAFGTAASLSAYKRTFPNSFSTVQTAIFPALEPICATCNPAEKERLITFLGAFETRKGVLEVLASWRLVQASDSTISFCIVGQGPLAKEVEQACVVNGYELSVNPSRDFIHQVLNRAKVLTLPSIASGGWKEQIGLPILEGLSHGCEIVTTSDTGIADWLADHGHGVLDVPFEIQALVSAQLAAVNRGRSADEVKFSLPLSSGRIAAQEWLWQ